MACFEGGFDLYDLKQKIGKIVRVKFPLLSPIDNKMKRKAVERDTK